MQDGRVAIQHAINFVCLKGDPWKPEPDLAIVDWSWLPSGPLRKGKMSPQYENLIHSLVNYFKTFWLKYNLMPIAPMEESPRDFVAT